MKIKMLKCFCAFAVLSILLSADGTGAARILALFPFASRSHMNVFGTLTTALAKRGHDFVVVTSTPIDSPPPNYKQISVYDLVQQHFKMFNVTQKLGVINLMSDMKKMVEDICRNVLAKDEIKKLILKTDKEKFDAIIISNFFTECFYGFSHVYNVPMISVSPGGPFPTTYGSVGNVMLPSYYPNPILGFRDQMTFQERIINTGVSAVFSLFYKHYIQRYLEIEMKIGFGEQIPSISELQKNISIVLLNNHFSLNEARPTVPNLIEVGGMQIKPPKEVAPQDLKEFLDGADKEGVIYFSLGSVLKSAGLPTETRDAFLGAFSQVKQKVLWKWEEKGPLPGQSINVRLEKWLPQQDVLAHPNIKLFITHGGLLSFQEATSRGVPLIGIPYFGDQDMNMQRVTDLKVGVKLHSTNLTTENILNAINKVLGDPTYATNMKKMKEIVSDQIDHPLDRAVYWVEYVIRHKGAKHLKPASVYLEWYQLILLDVIFVGFIIPNIVIGLVMFAAVKLIRKKLCTKKQNKSSNKKTQ